MALTGETSMDLDDAFTLVQRRRGRRSSPDADPDQKRSRPRDLPGRGDRPAAIARQDRTTAIALPATPTSTYEPATSTSPELLSVNGLFIIILQPLDKDTHFKKMNPLHLKRALTETSKLNTNVHYLRHGALVLKTECRDAAIQFMNTTELLQVPVRTSVPRSEREVRGLLFDIFAQLTNAEVLDEINSSDNESAFRATKVVQFGPATSTTRVVSFKGTSLPSYLNICLSRHKVRPFYEEPTQCYKCQKWGHIAQACRGKLRCLHCGKDHGHATCEPKQKKLPPVCCNCLGNHAAWSNRCPAKQIQIEICKVKARTRVSFAAAKAAVFPAHCSYADALSRRRQPVSAVSMATATPPPPEPVARQPAAPSRSDVACQSPASFAPAAKHAPPPSRSDAACQSPASFVPAARTPQAAMNQEKFCTLVKLIADLALEDTTADEVVSRIVNAAKEFGIRLPLRVAQNLFIQFED